MAGAPGGEEPRGGRTEGGEAARAGPASGGEGSGGRTADRLHSAAIRLLRALRTEDDATGLSAPRLSALSVLVYRGPMTVGELARAEQVRPPSTSRLLGELEALGLVERHADPADGRVRRVSATAEGRRVLEEGRRRRVARLRASIERLSPSERTDLARGLEVLEALDLEARRSGT